MFPDSTKPGENAQLCQYHQLLDTAIGNLCFFPQRGTDIQELSYSSVDKKTEFCGKQ